MLKIWIFLVSLYFAALVLALVPPCKQTCLIKVKCSNFEDFVYGSDNVTCTRFTNECHLNTENCNRENRCVAILKNITEAECNELKPVCNQACSSFTTCSNEGPVAYGTDDVRCVAFPNSCQLSFVNCERYNRCEPPFRPVKSCSEICDKYKYVKCSNIGTGVYATDGLTCLLYPNSCQLGLANCHRANRREAPLLEASEEECQCVCNRIACTRIYEPVCAQLNSELQVFPSLCALNRYNCGKRSDEAFVYQYEGECQTAPLY